MKVLHLDARRGAADGWATDPLADLAVDGVRRWVVAPGGAARPAATLVELPDRPSRAAVARLASLAGKGPVAVRLWEAAARPGGRRPADGSEGALAEALGLARLVLVSDRAQLVRLAGRATIDPGTVALAAATLDLASPPGSGVCDLRRSMSRRDLGAAVACARTVVVDAAPAWFLAGLVGSGRGVVLCGGRWPLEGAPPRGVELLEPDPCPAAVSEASARATADASGERAALRRPRWWSRLEGITGALDPIGG